MGLYTKENYLALPCSRIVDDVLLRSGQETYESFTPFDGMRYMLDEQISKTRYRDISYEDILDDIAEFKFSKARALDEMHEGIDRKSIEKFVTRLEDLSPEFMEKHIREQLIGLKVHTKSSSSMSRRDMEKITPAIRDEEDGKLVALSDIHVESEHITESERMDLINKIPHLLKKIHDGSIKYGTSLISMLVARILAERKTGKYAKDLAPRELLACDNIWRVDLSGNTTTKWDKETANNREQFIIVRDLIKGLDPTNPYYIACMELYEVATKLGIDITKEDVTLYNSFTIGNILNTYVCSMQEVLSELGKVDKNILDSLSATNLFKKGNNNSKQPISKMSGVEQAMWKKELATRYVKLIGEGNGSKVLTGDAITQFLDFYNESENDKFYKHESAGNITIDGGFLCNSNKSPLILNLTDYVSGFSYTTAKSRLFLITEFGNLILIDRNYDKLEYTTLDSIYSVMYKLKNKQAVNESDYVYREMML